MPEGAVAWHYVLLRMYVVLFSEGEHTLKWAGLPPRRPNKFLHNSSFKILTLDRNKPEGKVSMHEPVVSDGQGVDSCGRYLAMFSED